MDMRDIKGRFADGHSGGPGRPRRQIERECLRATLAGCSLEDWEAIVAKAVTDAKAGDAKAREWLGKYLLGIPETVAPTAFQVAVEDEAGADPVGREAAHKREQAQMEATLQLS